MNEQTLSELQNRRHKRALQIIKRWRLMDDDFMKRCLKDNIPAVECYSAYHHGAAGPYRVICSYRGHDSKPLRTRNQDGRTCH